MFSVSPSLLSADLMHIGDVLKQTREFEHLHLDIDDGNFVDGISFGLPVVNRLREFTNVPLDAHLEVMNPMDYALPLCDAGVDLITAHVETLDFPSEFLTTVRNRGKMAGLALNIKTPLEFLECYEDMLDCILLLSIEEDDDGYAFCEGILKKIRKAKTMFPHIPVWVDGAVNPGNLERVIEAGADSIVVGRGVFAQPDPAAAYKELLELGRSYERKYRK